MSVTRLQALSTLRAAMVAFGEDKTAELFVDLLIKTNGLYHFDDSPYTIININSDERTFTDDEAKVITEIVDYCYSSPKLFDLAIKHVESL